jgi:hypothetical protein
MNYTDSLGDFMNILPVFSGLYQKVGKIDLVVRDTTKRFNGFLDALQYQGIFNTTIDDSYEFDRSQYTQLKIDDPADESSDNPNRPGETRRWHNTIQRITGIEFQVDDDYELKYPKFDLQFDKDKFLVGDRWNGPLIDGRRATNVLQYLGSDPRFVFMNYSYPLLVNCFLIKESNKPFISNQTGIAVVADLLKKETLMVWKVDDWHPAFRDGDNISWGAGEGFGGRSVQDTFLRNQYADRKCRMVHADDLEETLKKY